MEFIFSPCFLEIKKNSDGQGKLLFFKKSEHNVWKMCQYQG